MNHRRYALREDAFDDVQNDLEAQYWIGFILGDGCVKISKSGQHCLALAITIADRKHVESFRDFLGSTQPVRIGRPGGYPNSKPKAELVVSSKKLVQAVAACGIVPRKSVSVRIIGLESSAAFWRGCIDADGYLSLERDDGSRYPEIGLVGCKTLLKQFAAFVRSVAPEAPAAIHPMNGIWRVVTTGRRAVKVVTALYGNATVALHRKLEIAKKIMGWESRYKDWSHLTLEKLNEMRLIHKTWADVAKALGMPCQQSLNQVRKALLRRKESG